MDWNSHLHIATPTLRIGLGIFHPVHLSLISPVIRRLECTNAWDSLFTPLFELLNEFENSRLMIGTPHAHDIKIDGGSSALLHKNLRRRYRRLRSPLPRYQYHVNLLYSTRHHTLIFPENARNSPT